eukprot:NODE_5141_length_529_cov_48.631250_g3798_i0.p1 GENE.NODE_5141_length_529_cov_48.631250_g3798_i0~~NODE_5141_length_529_cov_48.631250_g3798_i0.p1  ORF type:complete len:137 (-),score=14.78 NODE_5141_length_529_cov_48.631250_g3798_i0:118-480(-)
MKDTGIDDTRLAFREVQAAGEHQRGTHRWGRVGMTRGGRGGSRESSYGAKRTQESRAGHHGSSHALAVENTTAHTDTQFHPHLHAATPHHTIRASTQCSGAQLKRPNDTQPRVKIHTGYE